MVHRVVDRAKNPSGGRIPQLLSEYLLICHHRLDGSDEAFLAPFQAPEHSPCNYVGSLQARGFLRIEVRDGDFRDEVTSVMGGDGFLYRPVKRSLRISAPLPSIHHDPDFVCHDVSRNPAERICEERCRECFLVDMPTMR